jgi:hypothetical protein
LFKNEKELQDEIGRMLDSDRVQYVREMHVGKNNILDFLLVASRSALEIKTKGAEMAILRQLKRYADLAMIDEVILVCPRPFRLPASLSGKPLHVVAIFGSMI